MQVVADWSPAKVGDVWSCCFAAAGGLTVSMTATASATGRLSALAM